MDRTVSCRTFVSYIDRSREYYVAQGYERPYAWPHYDEVPSAHWGKPSPSAGWVGDHRTSAQRAAHADKELYAAPSRPAPTRMRTMTCPGTNRPPIPTMSIFFYREPFGEMAPQVIGSVALAAHTDYNQSNTIQRHAPRPRGAAVGVMPCFSPAFRPVTRP